MCIQESRRSYRTYTYTDFCLFRTPVGVTELILIQNLCLFRTPIGVTELRLMVQSLNLFEGTRRYHRDYGTYTGFAELNLIWEYPSVLLNLYLSYGTYTDLTEHILVLQNLEMYFRSYTCLTEHILILRIREYS